MKDFNQIYAKINMGNKNKCEENGGVIYCYKCKQSPEMEAGSGGHYDPITIKVNMNLNIRVLPKYYLEYDPE